MFKEFKLDQLLESLPKKRAEERARHEEKVNAMVGRLLEYYKRECLVWVKCSGNNQTAKKNNLVELFGLADSYQGSLLPIFVSRYISEGSITAYMKNSCKPAFSDKEKILIVSDVTKALSFLHNLGIVHRDIKGRNILIERSSARFVGLLGDFGSAKMLEIDFLRNLSSTTNEDRWSPPEYLLESHPYHNEKGPGDIWALGCMLLEVLQEEEPWQPLRSEAFKLKLCNYEYPVRGNTVESTMIFRQVQDGFYDFMKKCWKKEKSDRISAKDAHVQLLQLANECDQ